MSFASGCVPSFLRLFFTYGSVLFLDPKSPGVSLSSMRPNNFDIVRLLLALTVVFIHSWDLSQSSSLLIFTRFLNARVAVEGFFAISGFLIFASYERCTSLGQYFSNRAFRILPGYWLSTLLCLAIAFATGHFQVGEFLVGNLTFLNFLHPGIPGVFESNPGNAAMNGALWTIKIEVAFYCAVPILVWLCRRLHRDAVLIVCILLSILYRILFASHETLAVQLPGQLCFFLVGTLIYYYLTEFKRHGGWIMLAAALLYLLHIYTGWFFLRPFTISTLTLGACFILPHIVGPTRWGDFSYGTYVLHYPILQSLIALGLFQLHPWLGLGVTLLLVATAAGLSWFFVEKPSLDHARDRKLRLAADGVAPNYPPAVP
jgi:peptidoglycan/LPS O-acetylase OafA/YrhL